MNIGKDQEKMHGLISKTKKEIGYLRRINMICTLPRGYAIDTNNMPENFEEKSKRLLLNIPWEQPKNTPLRTDCDSWIYVWNPCMVAKIVMIQ